MKSLSKKHFSISISESYNLSNVFVVSSLEIVLLYMEIFIETGFTGVTPITPAKFWDGFCVQVPEFKASVGKIVIAVPLLSIHESKKTSLSAFNSVIFLILHRNAVMVV